MGMCDVYPHHVLGIVNWLDSTLQLVRGNRMTYVRAPENPLSSCAGIENFYFLKAYKVLSIIHSKSNFKVFKLFFSGMDRSTYQFLLF